MKNWSTFWTRRSSSKFLKVPPSVLLDLLDVSQQIIQIRIKKWRSRTWPKSTCTSQAIFSMFLRRAGMSERWHRPKWILSRGSFNCLPITISQTSSRSHSIFSITIHLKEKNVEGDDLLKVSLLIFFTLSYRRNRSESSILSILQEVKMSRRAALGCPTPVGPRLDISTNHCCHFELPISPHYSSLVLSEELSLPLLRGHITSHTASQNWHASCKVRRWFLLMVDSRQ